MPQRRPHASRRLGDNYQDIIGIEYLIQMLRNPDIIQWVTFEAAEGRSLDDVVVAYKDHIAWVQVKYAVEDDVWSLDDLLVAKNNSSASLLEKWIGSWQGIRQLSTEYKVMVRTNRRPAPDLAALLKSQGGWASDLWSDPSFAPTWLKIRNSVNISKQDLKAFLGEFQFRFGEPDLEEMHDRLRGEFLGLGGSLDGWKNLLDEARRWVLYQEPKPDGKIRVGDVRRHGKLWDPSAFALAEDFPGDPTTFIFDFDLHQKILGFVTSKPSGCLVLKGAPGCGKSSFINWLAHKCSADVDLVLRHHCFVSVEDETYYRRASLDGAAMALLSQISRDCRELLTKPENPRPEDLADWLREIAGKLYQRGKKVLLLLDGLDHLAREHDLETARELLKLLPMPIPDGLWILIGTQPLTDILPQRILSLIDTELEVVGFDRRAISLYAQAYVEDVLTDSLLTRLTEVSQGNPLFLRYIMEKAREEGRVTESLLAELPPYGGQIGQYYKALWSTLSIESQLLVGVLAYARTPILATDLHFLLRELGCSEADAVESIRSVNHLLRKYRDSRTLYHASLREFTKEQSGIIEAKPAIFTALCRWLESRADEGTRWSLEWEYELETGNSRPLLEGLTRDWIISAFANLRPKNRIVELLQLGLRVAGEHRDLRSMLRLGALLSYTNDIAEYVGKNVFTSIVQVHSRRQSLGNLTGILEPATGYDVENYVPVAKRAASRDQIQIAQEVFDVFLAKKQTQESEDILLVYQLAAYADIEPIRVLKHYRQLSQETELGGLQHQDDLAERSLKQYIEALIELGRSGTLARLMQESDVTVPERVVFSNALARHFVRANRADDLRQLLSSSPGELQSPYLAALAVAAGMDNALVSQLLPQVPLPPDADKPAIRYGQSSGWHQKYLDILWTVFASVRIGDSVKVDAYEASLRSSESVHAKAVALIVQWARRSQQAIESGHFDIVSLIHDLDQIQPPKYPSSPEFYPWKLFSNSWFSILQELLELLRLGRVNLQCDRNSIELMWRSPHLVLQRDFHYYETFA